MSTPTPSVAPDPVTWGIMSDRTRLGVTRDLAGLLGLLSLAASLSREVARDWVCTLPARIHELDRAPA